MSHRRRRTVGATIRIGIQKLPLLLDCKTFSMRICNQASDKSSRYVMSLVLKQIFMFKCNLSMLRLTPMLALVLLPLILTHLLCFHQRERPPHSWYMPSPEAVIISSFPIAWFFGFLYYTEVPSLVFVIATITASTSGMHWLAALVIKSTPLEEHC